MNWQMIIPLMGTISAIIAAIIGGCIALWTAHEGRKICRELEADKAKYVAELAAKQAEYTADLASKKNELASQMEQYKRYLDRKEDTYKVLRQSEAKLLPRGLDILHDLHNHISIMQERSAEKGNINDPIKLGETIFCFLRLDAKLKEFLEDSKLYLDNETNAQIQECYDSIELLGKHYLFIIGLNPEGNNNSESMRKLICGIRGMLISNLPALKQNVELAIEKFKKFLNSKRIPYSDDKIKRKELKFVDDREMALVDKE